MTNKILPLALQLYKGHTFSLLNSFKDYIIHSDKSIISAQQEFEKDFIASEIETETNDSLDDYWDYEYLKLHEIFPAFYRQSAFIGLYSFLETRLQSLCNNIQRLKIYKLKISDLAGENFIEKSKKYLKLVVELDIDDLNASWIKITNYQKIRNCFIHNSGNIFTDKSQPIEGQRYYAVVKDNTDLEIEHNGTIKICNDDFLINFILVIDDYLRSLLNKIENQIEFN